MFAVQTIWDNLGTLIAATQVLLNTLLGIIAATGAAIAAWKSVSSDKKIDTVQSTATSTNQKVDVVHDMVNGGAAADKARISELEDENRRLRQQAHG